MAILRATGCAAVIAAAALTPLAAQDTAQAAVPTLTNEAEVADVVRSKMPRNLRDVAAGFTTVMRVLVNDTGSVDSLRTVVTSGWGWLDRIAYEAAQKARFTVPAAAGSDAARPWVDLPIRFARGASAEQGRAGAGPPVNRDDIVAYLQAEYPDDLRQWRIRGTTDARLLVTPDGRVQDADVERWRCFPTLGDQVEKAARALIFPADSTSSDTRRVLLTATFSRDTARVRVTGDTLAPSQPREPRPEPEEGGPTRRPQLRNGSVVASALRTHYPKQLADAGIGGTAVIWSYVDTSGTVAEVQLHRSSGRCELDIAAMRVANEMRFSPALNKGREVEVWVEQPIIFGRARR